MLGFFLEFANMDRDSINLLLKEITIWWPTAHFTYEQKERIQKTLSVCPERQVDACVKALRQACKRAPSPAAVCDIIEGMGDGPLAQTRRKFENNCPHCPEKESHGYVTIYRPQFVWDYMTGKEPTMSHYTCCMPCICNTVDQAQKYDPQHRWALWQEKAGPILAPTLAVPMFGGGNTGANPDHQTDNSHVEYLRRWLEDHQPSPAAWQAYRNATQGVDEFTAWNDGA